MSLRYIMGKPDTGKTTLCIDEIAKCDNMKERLFYIVPEQFTLESEKNLIDKKGSLININVLGFRHFAYYLISKMGTSGRAMLDDVGRAMLIRKVVSELKDKLGFYKNSADRQGFIDNIDMTITELMQYSITVEKIGETAENMKEGNLKNKLEDIKLIFEKYREYMNKEYIAGDGALELLAEYIPYSIVKGSEVWIDGFKSFTPQENKVIEQLLKYCKRVNITFTINSPITRYSSIASFDEQYEVKRAVTKITNIAMDNGVEIEPVVFLDKTYRKSCNEIEFIKNNYFKYKFVPYKDEVKNVAVYRASNMYDEIYKICSEIKKLVQYKGYRYKDIALIAGNECYEKPLSIALKKYEIPNFLDGRREVSSHPLITFIMGAVDIIAYGWSNDAVFKMLKTGYTDIDFERIYSLENYVQANGIDKYKWNREWKYGFKEEGQESDKPDKKYINETKNMIFELMVPLNENFTTGKKGNIREITEKLFDILESINIREKLEKEINEAQYRGDSAKTAFYEQIWKTVIDVFDKLVSILGNEKVTMREYSKIIGTGFGKATVGIAPTVQDCILVGDMERTRLPDIKAMFILGANEGNIPVKISERGVFTDDERLVMEENNMELAPGVVQMTNNGRLGIYLNIIKPEEYLAVSYPAGSIRGESLKPSSLVTRIESMFTELVEINIDKKEFEPETVLTGKSAAFDRLIEAVSANDESDFIKDLYSYYSNDVEYGKKLKSIRYGLLSQIPKKYITDRLLPEIWEQVLNRASVSKLEKFTSCPFKFYMEYILRAKEKEVYALRNNDIGTLAHRIMEAFSKYINDGGISWENTDKEYTDAFVDSHIGDFIREMNTDIFESNRNAAILEKIKEASKYALWANVEQVKASRFKPENFEISFGRYNSAIPAIEIEIDEGRILKLNGVIDRVDKMMNEKGSVYVKIVDYKSSNKKLDINKIYKGLQLQLVLYMNSLVSQGKAKAGGMFYFEVNEPKLIEEEKINLSAEDSMLKRLALNGMYDESIEKELDSAYYEGTKGRNKEIVKILRDISEKESEKLTADKMNELLKFSREIVKDIGSEMAKGNIEISPYKYGSEEDSCKFCPYGRVCDFENGDKSKLRNIIKNDDAAWEEIHRRVSEEHINSDDE